jgi:hypothetical protein
MRSPSANHGKEGTSRSWRTETLASVVATAALVGGGWEASRWNHLVTVQQGQDMSPDAVELAHRETMLSLEAQEILRREGDVAVPRHAPVPAVLDVSDRATVGPPSGRTAQTQRVETTRQPVALSWSSER